MQKQTPVRPGSQNYSVPNCIVIFILNFFILPEILVPGTPDRYRPPAAAKPTFPPDFATYPKARGASAVL